MNYRSLNFTVSLEFCSKEMILQNVTFHSLNARLHIDCIPQIFLDYDACRGNNITSPRVGVILDAKAMTLTWKKNKEVCLS